MWRLVFRIGGKLLPTWQGICHAYEIPTLKGRNFASFKLSLCFTWIFDPSFQVIKSFQLKSEGLIIIMRIFDENT